MTETLRPLKAMPATQGFRFVEPTTAFDQRHLGRKVITLKHLDGLRTAAEAHVVSAAVVAASQEPAGVHTQPPSFKAVWRSQRPDVGGSPGLDEELITDPEIVNSAQYIATKPLTWIKKWLTIGLEKRSP